MHILTPAISTTGHRYNLTTPDLTNVEAIDRGCLPMLHEMMGNGIWLNQAKCNALAETLRQQESDYIARIRSATGQAINPESGDQVAALLFDSLELHTHLPKLPKLTKSRKRYTTDDGLLSMLRVTLSGMPGMESLAQVVSDIASARECNTLRTTFAEPLPAYANRHRDKRLRTRFKYTTARTGRLSCVAGYTPILTIRGEVPIQDVKVGDLVWTHRGRWRRVTRLWRKGWESMVSIRFSTGHILTCTKSHRLLIYSNEYLQKMDQHTRECGVCVEPLQIHRIPNIGTDSPRSGGHLPHRTLDMQEPYAAGRVQDPKCDTVFTVEGRGQESDEGQDQGTAPQLDRGGIRWSRVSDLLGYQWKASICTPYGNGQSTWYRRITGIFGCTPYRWGQDGQRTGQSGPSYQKRPSTDPLPTTEGYGICGIEEVKAAGSLEVFDITVEEDHSYLACGIFSHNSEEPNLQNIPIRSEYGKAIRDCFEAHVPGKDTVLVSCDYSQIEMRVAAHMSGDAAMSRIFTDNLDIHSQTAATIFRVPVEAVDKRTQRLPAKTLGFGILYGVQGDGLQDQIFSAGGPWWSVEQCESLIAGWFDAYPGIARWIALQHALARRHGYVCDLVGRFRWVPEARSVHERVRDKGFRECGNFPIQAGAQAVIKMAMGIGAVLGVVRRYQQYGVCMPLLQVHDELIFEVGSEMAQDFAEECSRVMAGVVELDVPVATSSDIGPTWGGLK